MTTVVVKSTFLEVEEDAGDDEAQPTASRTVTAPGLLMGKTRSAGGGRPRGGSETAYEHDGEGWQRAGPLEPTPEDEEEVKVQRRDRKSKTEPNELLLQPNKGRGRGRGLKDEDEDSASPSKSPNKRSPKVGMGSSKRSPKVTKVGSSKRSPKQAQHGTPSGVGGAMANDPWGFAAQAQAAQAAQVAQAAQLASVGMLPGVAPTAPPMPMPMMPGLFPPWPPAAANPMLAAMMNANLIQMMAVGMPGAMGMPTGAAAGGSPTAGMPGAAPGVGAAPGAPASPQRRNKKGQQQQQQMMDSGAAEGRTTVMLRNVPNNYTRAMLLELLDAQGLQGRYDFVYLPFDFKTEAGLGFAFVNLLTPGDAEHCKTRLTGFRNWAIPSGKVCEVGWSGADQQGLEANVDRYRNSSVMHASVPEELKPVKLIQGIQVMFPKPTRKVWPPHSNYGLRARRAQGLA